MAAITFKGFRGKRPRMSERLLADNQATDALNLKITSGRIDPLKGLLQVHSSLIDTIVTMRRYRFAGVDSWLVWNKVVDVAKSPAAQDVLGRFYYTGDGEPRMSTGALATAGPGPFPADWYVLGVVPPKTAPSIAVVGGVAPTEARAYVYTFVTKLAETVTEESGPSPAAVFTGNITGSWDLSAMDAAPPNTGTVTAAVPDTPLPGQVEVTLNTVFGLRALEHIEFAAVTGMTDLNTEVQIVSVDTALNKVVVTLATAQTYTAGGAWTRRAPHNTTGMVKRIYRTVGTGTDYKFVAEIPVANTTYSDTIAATALGDGISTLDADLPPKDLHSLIELPNGCLAGLSGNELCLTEIAKPNSWPIRNRYSFSGVGVALVADGSSIVVMTDGFPYVAAVSTPDAVSLARIQTYAPCLSKPGVVDTGGGAIYPSSDGLYVVSSGGARKLSQELYRFDEWQKTFPATFKSAFWDGQYVGMHATPDTEEDRILMFDTAEMDGLTEVDDRVDAFYTNPYDGLLYAAKGNKIYQWDADDSNRYLAFWKSRDVQVGKPVNFTCAQVHAQYSDIVPVDTSIADANAALLADADNVNGAIASASILEYTINGSAIVPVPTGGERVVQFTLLRYGVPIWTKNVTSTKAFRLPAGFKTEVSGMQIATNVPVFSVSLATTMAELSGISG